MALPKDKRHTEEQVVAFAKKATQQNQFHRSRRLSGTQISARSVPESHGMGLTSRWQVVMSDTAAFGTTDTFIEFPRCGGARALISVL